MLVLTRHALTDPTNSGQSEIVCRIPPSDKEQTIVLTLVETRGSTGKLGVTAPKEITILRRELTRQCWVDSGPEIKYGGEG